VPSCIELILRGNAVAGDSSCHPIESLLEPRILAAQLKERPAQVACRQSIVPSGAPEVRLVNCPPLSSALSRTYAHARAMRLSSSIEAPSCARR